MATDDDLRNRLRGEPGATPEDTRSELLSDLETRGLRAAPGATPEDTRSELLERQKEARKADEADAMRDEAIAIARAWTEEQAKQRAARDLTDHGQLVAVGARGDGDAYYLRSDMALRARESDFYSEALKSADAALHARVLDVDKENVSVDVAARLAASTVEDVREIRPKGESLDPAALEQLAAARQRDNAAARQAMGLGAEKAVDDGLKAQLEDDVRRRKAREQELAGQGLNAVDVKRSGAELLQGEFIMPKRIANTYTELDGKFFTKDTNRVAFEVNEVKIATHSTDKRLIEDMMAVAKAKGWQDIKLSGSQEFRREAWLQAESQGIATKGYTPKQSDLAALDTLRAERTTNTITPVADRKAALTDVRGPEKAAPRHNINTNQAAMHVEASKYIASNLEALQKNPALASRSVEDLSKLAYWRGIVAEENKAQPAPVKDEALARFDKLAADPQFVKRLDAESQQSTRDKTTERAQRRDTPEHSL